MAKGQYKYFWRIRKEASFGASAVAGVDWNIGGNGGGGNGWMDLPIMDNDGLQPKTTPIFPVGSSGTRGEHNADPVPGAYPVEAIGTFTHAVYPEQMDRILQAVLGAPTRTETAGTAALTSTAFASLATLDTQPNGTEQLEFTIASSTAASAAAINIIQSGSTVETITIGTSVSSVDGVYYSKGGYDGSTNAITFSVDGTVTAGTVVVAGIDYVSNVFKADTSDTLPTFQIEQGGRPEAGSGNSEFFNGVVIPSLTLSYDRQAADGLFMAEYPIHARYPSTSTAGAYANDDATYYKPFAAWNAAVTIGGVSWAEVASFTMTLASNNQLYAVSSGNQQPSGASPGRFVATGQFTIFPDDETRWDDYENATALDMAIEFLTPHYVVDTTPYQFKIDANRIFSNDYARARAGQLMSATFDFTCVFNSTDAGPAAVTTRCRMPV